ncbi:DNA adenine methylase [Patescibacteria group bacterium]|nr:DNA adenine methylase [Patescibacteria group bacterium]
MGVNVIDFIIVSEKDIHSVFQSSQKEITHYVSDGVQHSLFDLLETEQQTYTPTIKKIHKVYFYPESRAKAGRFQLQNRRYLGNKYKLLGFIEDIVNEKCNGFSIFCDIFAGTGVVAERFNEKNIKVIANDFLSSNFIPLKAFLGTSKIDLEEIEHKINLLNELKATDDNYFSKNFGNTYFTLENARKIGAIREKINELSNNEDEKAVLIASLLYAVDKVANTVGHYDAFRKKLDTVQPLRLLVPDFEPENNVSNEIYKEDANQLIRKINCDVLYIDPPYNSRQYSDAYHLLENLATWEKPIVHGIAKKMDRSHIKSDYCLQSATKTFSDLITNANCKHILLSYNNTGESKDGRSNARINDEQIINILKSRGDVDIFERDYKAFTTGKSDTNGHSERVFYCKVTK